MSKNLFLEINDQRGHRPMYVGYSLRTWAKACVRRHTPVYAIRVSEVEKIQVVCNNG